MESENKVLEADALAKAFPEVNLEAYPLGGRVMLQMKILEDKTKSGIILASDTTAEERWNSQVGKVIALGPLAYKNRETARPWPEGMWVAIGDFVRCPRWGGDRMSFPSKDDPSVLVPVVIFADHEIIAKVLTNPLEIKNYIL